MKTKFLSVALRVLVLMFCLLIPSKSSALSVTTNCPDGSCDLSELTAAGTYITVDDITFSNFKATQNNAVSEVILNLGNVGITGTQVGSDIGLLFQISGGFQAAGANQDGDIILSFDVICNSCVIEGAGLFFTGGSAGTGLATISEALSGSGVNESLLVTHSGAVSVIGDYDTFNQVNSLKVVKDIAVNSGVGPDGVGFISDFTETFTLYRPQVPEPSALLLLGAGLIGVAAWGRRK